jgi:hypothetical protein
VKAAARMVRPAAAAAAPPLVTDALRSVGRPLEPAVRDQAEARFRHDFSRVRVHTDQQAAASALALNALAYTVGHDVVFGAGRYAPHSDAGNRLLSHELAHVVQQSGAASAWASLPVDRADSSLEREAAVAAGGPATGRAVRPGSARNQFVQRDLATPEPTPAAPAQADLTDAQIRDAIRFNSQRYDAANTRLIQNILGGPVTGRWTRENIEAIAATQEQFGLKKDGKVGADTFEFIVREQQLEGVGTETQNCLTMFSVVWQPDEWAATPGPNGTTRIRGHHVVEARFSSRCNCSEFEYRQFIAGVAGVQPASGGPRVEMKNSFPHIPVVGHLPAVITEDGMTQCPQGINYGHRDQAGQPSTTTTCGENQYRDADGTPNQPSGCVYRGEDFPVLTVRGLNTGDVTDLLIQFRGEIRRNRRTIATREWTDIDETVSTP